MVSSGCRLSSRQPSGDRDASRDRRGYANRGRRGIIRELSRRRSRSRTPRTQRTAEMRLSSSMRVGSEDGVVGRRLKRGGNERDTDRRNRSHADRSRERNATTSREVLAPRRRRCEARVVSQSRSTCGKPRALFLMGLPGAGKTTVKRRRLHRGDLDIEPDQLKRGHPRFSRWMGEDTDDEVHRWSVRRAVDTLDDAVRDPRKPNLVFDTSGSNSKWLMRQVESARDAGYTTELLWVDVPMEIAIFRNRNRAVDGGQWCPERVIMDKAAVMEQSFADLRHEVDSADRLQNWSERSGELSNAKQDLYLYPGPRDRPCSVRPGEEGYGEMSSGARSPSPSRDSRRTISIGPWKRNDQVTKEKNARLSWMDRTYRGNREKFVLREVLAGKDVVIEPNMFPYHLPPDISHWTIWSQREFQHNELCEYIEAWLNARTPHNIIAWNYDDNRGRRTIEVWHVHLYLQGTNGQAPVLNCTACPNKRMSAGPGLSLNRSPCSV